ncbi:hypothetical protein ACFQ1S_45925, partial [Kibdelosporangium lantanae]
MRLTLRDGFAAVVMALIVLVYVLYLNGTDFLLVSGVRATATTMLSSAVSVRASRPLVMSVYRSSIVGVVCVIMRTSIARWGCRSSRS